MTLNGVITVISCYFISNAVALRANYVKMIGDRSIVAATNMSKECSLYRAAWNADAA